MAQTMDQLIASFDEAIDKAPGLVLKHTEQGALGALALVDLRITETGKSASGGAFQDYTPSYKAKKTKAGRYRGIVDFQLTGQMLASTTTGFERIGVSQRAVSGGNVRISFEGRDEFTRKKLDGNNKKRPGFLNPSKDEMVMVTKAANDGLARDLADLFT